MRPLSWLQHGVGWGWLRAIATRHDVHILTADWMRPKIEQFSAQNDLERMTFHYVSPTFWDYNESRLWTTIHNHAKPLVNVACVPGNAAPSRRPNDCKRRSALTLSISLPLLDFVSRGSSGRWTFR